MAQAIVNVTLDDKQLEEIVNELKEHFEERIKELEERIRKVRELCAVANGFDMSEPILAVLDGEGEKAAHDAVTPGERCNHMYAYNVGGVPAQVIVECELRRHGSFGPHAGSFRGAAVTWTAMDHREPKEQP